MERSSLYRSDWTMMAFVSLLFACMLIPLMLHARDIGEELRCTQRLGKIAGGVVSFAKANNAILPNNRRQPFASWNTAILPHLGREDLFDRYNLGRDWWEEPNRSLGRTHQAELVCPLGPEPKRVVHLLDPEGKPFQVSATDYVGSAGVYLFRNKPERLYRGALASPGRYYGGSKITADHAVKLSEVTDGASNTLLIVEMADKPNQWRAGKLHEDRRSNEVARPLVEGFSFGQWVAPNWNHLRAYEKDGSKAFGPCAVNCSNSGSLYGFHSGYDLPQM